MYVLLRLMQNGRNLRPELHFKSISCTLSRGFCAGVFATLQGTCRKRDLQSFLKALISEWKSLTFIAWLMHPFYFYFFMPASLKLAGSAMLPSWFPLGLSLKRQTSLQTPTLLRVPPSHLDTLGCKIASEALCRRCSPR